MLVNFIRYNNTGVGKLMIHFRAAGQHLPFYAGNWIYELNKAGAAAAHTGTQAKAGYGKVVCDQGHQAVISGRIDHDLMFFAKIDQRQLKCIFLYHVL